MPSFLYNNYTVPDGLSLHDTLIIDFSELYIQKLSI